MSRSWYRGVHVPWREIVMDMRPPELAHAA